MKGSWTFVVAILIAVLPALAQDVPIGNSLFPAPQGAADKEEQLYDAATSALNQSQWQDALDGFQKVARMNGRRADASLYWQAYSLNKLHRTREALDKIAELRKSYPQSKWLKDAGALEIEVRQAAGQHVDPQAQADEDLQLIAIQGLMNSDQARALPLLEGILNNPNKSLKLKERALFVLSQSDSPKARQIVISVAKGLSRPELQVKAIQQLAASGEKGTIQELVGIYNSSSDQKIKKTVLNTFGALDAKEATVTVARQERDPELRRAAINNLGAMGAMEQLRQLYQSSTSIAEKKQIMQAYGVAGADELLAQIGRNRAEPAEVRAAAIQALGIAGAKTGPVLVEIYHNDPEMRNAAIEALFIEDNAKALIDLARKETDPQMKRKLVERLSVMDNKEARDFMVELLNK